MGFQTPSDSTIICRLLRPIGDTQDRDTCFHNNTMRLMKVFRVLYSRKEVKRLQLTSSQLQIVARSTTNTTRHIQPFPSFLGTRSSRAPQVPDRSMSSRWVLHDHPSANRLLIKRQLLPSQLAEIEHRSGWQTSLR